MRNLTYYIVRDVVRGANCSYPAGRCCLRDVYTCPDQARAAAALYNQKCNVPGVYYQSLGMRDDQDVPCDYFENGNYPGAGYDPATATA